MMVRSIAGGVEVLAPAKLNLFLEVLGRRSDGYHEIESLMVAVSLHDRLTLIDLPTGEIRLECDDPGVPTGSDNLVMQAAERLKAVAGCERGARISLRKSIPMQAGLAGGSSDAAAALAGLDRLWGLGTSLDRFDAIAAEIGSDVSFFNHGPAAVCRGRGERVESVTLTHRYHFVVVCPPLGLSTAEVYRQVVPPEAPYDIEPTLLALTRGEPAELGRCLFNRLQPVAETIRPELTRVRNGLENLGPLLCGNLMSGSGSAYFGLCRDSAAASQAAEIVQQTLGLGWVRVVTCGP